MRQAVTAIARAFSIVGHPLVVVPAAVIALVSHGGVASPLLIVGIVLAVAGAVAAFSVFQVRRGRWQHVDASAHGERRTLNVFLALSLLVAAALAFLQLPQTGPALALLLSAILILATMSVSRWLKLSLHTAFASFATLLLWPLGDGYLVAGAITTAAVCWSRVSLGRHSIAEALGGCVLGALLGSIFWLALRAHG